MTYESFSHLEHSIKKIFLDIKNDMDHTHHTILFSPSAASFDSFKNFEDRGRYFNSLIKKFKNAK